MKYAYVLIHFGSNIKYFEYELYSIINLKAISKYDIVYMYSINDTPQKFVNFIEKLNVKTMSFDDNIILNKLNKFKSTYTHFNTLRTCAFIFANNLIEYDKICVVESDMIFMNNFDTVFDNNIPAILLYTDSKNIDKNYYISIDKKKFIKECDTNSNCNGGVLLFKPDKKIIKKYLKNLNQIVKYNCAYPNETLFLYTNVNIYNLPIFFNMSHYHLDKFKKIVNQNNILNYHFNSTVYKPLDIIKDNYIDSIKKSKHFSILFFKKYYYDKFNEYIKTVIKKIQSS
jgi:hypothetical protein